jgi:hypothetical protein
MKCTKHGINFIVTKINEDTWDVYFEDKMIGQISFGWCRNGGNGYYHKYNSFTHCKKIVDAAYDLYKHYNLSLLSTDTVKTITTYQKEK